VKGLSNSNDPIEVNAVFTQREFMPLCNSAPLLMLTVKLASIASDGLPPNAVYEHLFPYLPGNIKHIRVSFDFSTAEGVKQYKSQVDELISDLTHGSLTKYASSLSELLL
jgi:hypothetical protein